MAERHLGLWIGMSPVQWEAIQLVKNYTSEHAWFKVEYYLGLTPESEQSFQELTDHLSLAFQSCETVSSLIRDFYNWSQKARETKDTFADELQVPMRKHCSSEARFLGEGESSPETSVHPQFERPLFWSGCQGTMFGFPWLWEFHSILGLLGNDVWKQR